VLGVDRSAERRDIRRAYRRMAQIHHHDRVGVARMGEGARQAAHGRFLRVREAYRVLVS
jgi:DnaJ like chaperone protein